MQLTNTSFGSFHLYSIETGRFRLDGGAMFGVVPKTLWGPKVDVDDKNRVLFAMRCLLITSEITNRTYLIDNGAGTKFNDKFQDIYQLDYSGSNLTDSLAHHGFKPEDITDVIFTHLHFDHCGGTTYYDSPDNLAHTFPNAAYHITKKHWDFANDPNEREQASFLAENLEPLANSGRLNLVEGSHSYEEGLDTLIVNGHTHSQQLPLLTAANTKLLYAADLIPTALHLPLPWIMGYDSFPMQTLKEKKRILSKACNQKWYLFLEHDAQNEIITIHKKGSKYAVDERLTLNKLSSLK